MIIPPTTVYLAGPMQGLPQFNFPLFNAVAEKLREHGHHVFNPAAKDIERHGGVDISKDNHAGCVVTSAQQYGFSLRQALGDDTQFIAHEATALCLLPDWEFSSGALAEFFLARAIAKDPNNKEKFRFIYVHKLIDGVYTIPGVDVVDLREKTA